MAEATEGARGADHELSATERVACGAHPLPSPDMSGSTESTAAELATIADNIGEYRARVADLAEAHIGTDRDDFVGAIHEAERQIRIAERGLHRAIRSA